MSRRLFSADFHLGFAKLLEIEKWPFKTIEEHDAALLRSCIEDACAGDTIIHVGDLASYGMDRSGGIASAGLDVKPAELLTGVKADFVNIYGNHDGFNKVKSLCYSMRTRLGRRFPDVSVCHYPTYDRRAAGHFTPGDIHLCGHVHGAWRHCLDVGSQCLNINVGCMAWGFRLVSEEDLISYINGLLRHRPADLCRYVVENGRGVLKKGEIRK